LKNYFISIFSEYLLVNERQFNRADNKNHGGKREKAMKKRFTSFILLFMVMTFLLSCSVWADQKYYRDFIDGKKTLGFKPSSLFVNEIFHYIKNKYPMEVDDKTIFTGASKELRHLLSAYGIDPSGMDSLSVSGTTLTEFLKKYRDKVSQDLAVYAFGLGMVKSLQDQECELILPSQSSNPRRDIIPEGYGGIGILMEERENRIVVIYPFETGPGKKAGIKPGDRIVSVDGVSVQGMDLDAVMNRLRGEMGSKVNVRFQRGGDFFTRDLVREKVNANPVYVGVSGDGKGYIKIIYFSEDYPQLVFDAVESFRKKGIKTWILDIRDNAGGSLNPLIIMGSLFIPEKKSVMSIKYKDKETEHKSVARLNFPPPTAVIVNSYTTGSAEALAALFREYHGTKIYGTTTRGNAAVAEYFKLSGGATLKMTVGAMFTGNKKQIHKTGISPDVRIPEADNPASENATLNRVLQMIK
jgi:C-terminal peptidase prc